MTEYKPGVYPNLPYQEYWQINAANHSMLRHIDKSPAHAKQQITHPDKPAKAQDLGSMTHTAVLEPHLFDKIYVSAEEWRKTEVGAAATEAFLAIRKARMERKDLKFDNGFDRMTTEGKTYWKQFEEANVGRIAVDNNDVHAVRGMTKAIHEHPTAAALIGAGGYSEVTVVWRDEETGELCKTRKDRLTTLYGESIIVDLKTSIDASIDSFSQSVAKFNYDSQAAMYIDGAIAIGKKIKAFDRNWRHVHLVVETKPPYGVACYELNDAAIGTGRLKWHRWLKQYAECRKTGEWPAYQDGIHPLALPKWAIDSTLRTLEE